MKLGLQSEVNGGKREQFRFGKCLNCPLDPFLFRLRVRIGPPNIIMWAPPLI